MPAGADTTRSCLVLLHQPLVHSLERLEQRESYCSVSVTYPRCCSEAVSSCFTLSLRLLPCCACCQVGLRQPKGPLCCACWPCCKLARSGKSGVDRTAPLFALVDANTLRLALLSTSTHSSLMPLRSRSTPAPACGKASGITTPESYRAINTFRWVLAHGTLDTPPEHAANASVLRPQLRWTWTI